ncbi:MAG: ABC transporter ATP-binding protein [Acidimicrobiia bacterium]|nr:ABC transporter ATP-binding protein [Acidimicrobiia bacterium]
MGEPAIRVEGLRFSYGSLEALRGISFEVAPGEILGFLGPNGAGKSTTIKILTGQLAPGSGRAEVLGRAVAPDDPVLQARIGVCFEEKNLYDAMSGRENLRFFGRLFGIRDLDADGLLAKVGLAERGRDPVSKYSKGMRQRLMMARALVNTPQVLFLDEPTDGLDPVSSRAIRTLIRGEVERGAAVLLTTHDMFEADELSDRVAFINEGRIHAIDTPENLKLQHGRRAVKVRYRQSGSVTEESVPLDAPDAGERLRAAAGHPGLMTIHTEEATLESIFVEITGRALAG